MGPDDAEFMRAAWRVGIIAVLVVLVSLAVLAVFLTIAAMIAVG